MRATVLAIAGCALAVLFAVAFPQRNPRQQQAAAAPAADSISFRVVFGNQRTAPKDYSGSVSVTGGALRGLEPWRFLQNDAITGPNSWTLQIRRTIFENQPDAPQPMANGGPAPQNIVPAGLIVTVDASAASAQFHTAQGDFVAPVRDLAYGRVLGLLDNDVQVERVPTPDRVSPQSAEEHDYPSIAITRGGEVWTAWQAYQDRGDHVYARRLGGDVTRLTTEKGDIFRTSVAEDAGGRIHVAWSERRGADWNLYERVFDGQNWSPRAQITRANTPNVFHKLIAGPRGLSLVWVGYENGESYLYLASYSAGRWSEPRQIGGPSVWNPDGAFDRDGNLHVAWDSYAAGNYDIYYRRIGVDGSLAAVEQITKSPVFDAHPSIAVDGAGRPWVAWDQSGANWGKDWNHEDQDRSTVLYKDRSIRVVVRDGGAWKQAPDFGAAVPDRLKRYAELPHLAADASGRIWALFQIRTSGAIQRIDYWAAGGLWDLYLTSIDQGVWQRAAFVPRSTGRNEAAFQIAAGNGRAWMVWATDGRVIKNSTGNYQAPTMVHYDIFAAQASAPAPSGSPVLTAYTEPASRPQIMHPNERDDVQRIRAYRTTVGGMEYRILRGDFHRHTDISNDGAGTDRSRITTATCWMPPLWIQASSAITTWAATSNTTGGGRRNRTTFF